MSVLHYAGTGWVAKWCQLQITRGANHAGLTLQNSGYDNQVPKNDRPFDTRCVILRSLPRYLGYTQLFTVTK